MFEALESQMKNKTMNRNYFSKKAVSLRTSYLQIYNTITDYSFLTFIDNV